MQLGQGLAVEQQVQAAEETEVRLLMEEEVAVKDSLQNNMVRMGLSWAAEEIRVT